MLRRFHELAATATLRACGCVAITAQDIMRDWLDNYSVDQLQVGLGKRTKVATTGITLRLPDTHLRRYHEMAAKITHNSKGSVAVSAQDVMRTRLEAYPGLRQEASVSNTED
jgi:hypothetical protein